MADAAAPKPKRPRAPRKKADPNADLEVVPVGDKGTIFSLPTEILDQLISMLILLNPQHAIEFGLTSKFFLGMVHDSLGWKEIVERGKLKVPKQTKKVPFPFYAAVAKNWSKLCQGCHQVKKDKVSIEFEDGEPLQLCGECRVAHWDPSKDAAHTDAGRRISKSRAKEEFKISDKDLDALELRIGNGFQLGEVRQLARRLHGGDKGIAAVVNHAQGRREHLRTSRQQKRVERERESNERRELRKAALKKRLEELGLDVPESQPHYRQYVEGYMLGAVRARKGQVYEPTGDPQFVETVDRLVAWNKTREERRAQLPGELQKHGLEYSTESTWCQAYIDQTEYPTVSIERVVKELTELKWLFEHTDYRTVRFGENAGLDKTYLNDDDCSGVSYYTIRYQPNSRALGVRSPSAARLAVIREIIEKRFAAENTKPVTKEDEGLKDAPQSMLDAINQEIEERLHPPPRYMDPFGYGYGMFGGGQYSDLYDSEDEDDYGYDEDVCSIM